MPSETAKPPQIGAMFRGPGPARYLLPGSTGSKLHDPTKHKAPAYSMGARSSKLNDGSVGPGPAYLIPPRVTRVGVDGTPRYSLTGRTRSAGNFRTPAPGRVRFAFACLLKSSPAFLCGKDCDWVLSHVVFMTRLQQEKVYKSASFDLI